MLGDMLDENTTDTGVAEVAEKARSGKKHAREIRVLTYEPFGSNLAVQMSRMRNLSVAFDVAEDGSGFAASLRMREPEEAYRRQGQLEMMVDMMGSDQTVVSEQIDLIKQVKMGGMDVILIHDRSVPEHLSYGGFSSMLSETLPAQEMPGVRALKFLKDPESPYRHIPVIVVDAYPRAREIFERYGADGVLTSGMRFDVDGIAWEIAKALGLEDLENPYEERQRARWDDTYPEPEFYKPATAIIPPTLPLDDYEPDDAPRHLEGRQLDQFRINLLREAELLTTPGGIAALLKSDALEHHKHGRPHVACEADMRDPAEIGGKIAEGVTRVSQIVMERELNTPEKCYPVIDHATAQLGEQKGGLIYIGLLMVCGQAMGDARKSPTAKGVFLDLGESETQELLSQLAIQVAMLDYADTLGMKADGALVALTGYPGSESQAAQDEIAGLDEKAIAVEAAGILRTLISSVIAEQPQTSEDVQGLVARITGSERAKSTAEFLVGSAIEKASKQEGQRFVLSAAEFSALKAKLDAECGAAENGPKTKALLFAVSERMTPGMSAENIEYLTGTLGQYEPFGGAGGHPTDNVLDMVAAAIYDLRKVCVFGKNHSPVTAIVHVPAAPEI